MTIRDHGVRSRVPPDADAIWTDHDPERVLRAVEQSASVLQGRERRTAASVLVSEWVRQEGSGQFVPASTSRRNYDLTRCKETNKSNKGKPYDNPSDLDTAYLDNSSPFLLKVRLRLRCPICLEYEHSICVHLRDGVSTAITPTLIRKLHVYPALRPIASQIFSLPLCHDDSQWYKPTDEK